MRRAYALFAILLCLTAELFSYTIKTYRAANGTLFHPKWAEASFPIRYSVNDQAGSGLPNVVAGSDPVAAINRGFNAWAQVSSLRFVGDVSSATSVGVDGINLITFANTAANRDLVGNFVAFTTFRFDGSGNMREADVVFNPSSTFSDDYRTGTFKIQDVITHEIGHFVGLDHSGMSNSTMYPLVGTAAPHPALASPSKLKWDDIAAALSLYPPAGLGGLGSITGRVTANALPVFEAHIVAVNGSGISAASAVSLPDGSYRIDNLPPDQYTFFVEPLDGPVFSTNLTNGIFDNASLTPFRTTFFGGINSPTPVVVQAGFQQAVDIEAQAGIPMLNPRFVTFSDNGISFSSSFSLPLSINPGQSTFLVIVGSGLDTVFDGGVSLGGSDIAIGQITGRGRTTSGNPYIIIAISIDSRASPGGRNIIVKTPDEVASYTGGLEIAVTSRPRRRP